MTTKPKTALNFGHLVMISQAVYKIEWTSQFSMAMRDDIPPRTYQIGSSTQHQGGPKHGWLDDRQLQVDQDTSPRFKIDEKTTQHTDG
jgi:hypothetical protein